MKNARRHGPRQSRFDDEPLHFASAPAAFCSDRGCGLRRWGRPPFRYPQASLPSMTRGYCEGRTAAAGVLRLAFNLRTTAIRATWSGASKRGAHCDSNARLRRSTARKLNLGGVMQDDRATVYSTHQSIYSGVADGATTSRKCRRTYTGEGTAGGRLRRGLSW